jgi:molybdopterin synthase catalytic subunit/molybdopterin converting factor small subunit
MDQMHVEVLLFGRLREVARQRALRRELAPGATPADLWGALMSWCPALPALDDGAARVRVAVNETYCRWDTELRDGDVVAFIPPVAGGAVDDPRVSAVHVRITEAVLDARHLERMVRGDSDGAVCSFTGVVRDHHEGRVVDHLEYEAYVEMAEAEMRRVGEEALERTGASAVALWHRIGRLAVGEASVVVSASAAHRAEAFAACRYGIDALKERAPIFKKEHGPAGELWVEDGGQPS